MDLPNPHIPPLDHAECRHCGQPISKITWLLSGRVGWYHDNPLGALPRKGCRAASWDRRAAEGDPGWDDLPEKLKATPLAAH